MSNKTASAPVTSNPDKPISPVEAKSRLERIQRFQRRQESRNPAQFKKDEKTQRVVPDRDPIEQYVGVADAFGTGDINFGCLMLNQISNARPGGEEAPALNSAISAASGIKPQDELEGMLATQMIAGHNLAMEFLARAAKIKDSPEMVTQNIERATKLMRTFTAQIEALNRYRGKGQQKMIVEHVHVHEGGQAIVGVVDPSKPSGNREGGNP